jgi:hydrogenase expression/formation protein HypE
VTNDQRTKEDVLAAIERRRRRPHVKLMDEHVTLSHGAGGRSSRAMTEALFLPELRNAALEQLGDAGVVGMGVNGGRLAITTDSFVVKPLFFPGGDIGELAINGTVNDLAMVGARPLALSAGFIIEEGFPTNELQRIAASMGRAATAAGVVVAAGDTKVVERGKADGVYVNTTGVGLVQDGVALGPDEVRPGDRVIVSGTIGDHGMAVMVARGELDLEGDLRSDTAPVAGLAETLRNECGDGVHWMRDPTRGGLATVVCELALAADVSVALTENALPIKPLVSGACELLGIDPLYVANEGKLVAVVAEDVAAEALQALRATPLGADAAIVGVVQEAPPGMVILQTSFGGSRVVDMLAGDPLPRIC